MGARHARGAYITPAGVASDTSTTASTMPPLTLLASAAANGTAAAFAFGQMRALEDAVPSPGLRLFLHLHLILLLFFGAAAVGAALCCALLVMTGACLPALCKPLTPLCFARCSAVCLALAISPELVCAFLLGFAIFHLICLGCRCTRRGARVCTGLAFEWGTNPAVLEAGVECIICMEPMALCVDSHDCCLVDWLFSQQAALPLRTTLCGHTFHGRCIDQWVATKPGSSCCPICRCPMMRVAELAELV